MNLRDWVRFPSAWINQRRLRVLRWGANGNGSHSTAALMTLIAIAHAADERKVLHGSATTDLRYNRAQLR